MIDRIGLAAHRPAKPVGGDTVGSSRDDAVLAMPKRRVSTGETPQQRRERQAAEAAEKRSAAVAVCARIVRAGCAGRAAECGRHHGAHLAAARAELEYFGLVEPPPKPEPPSRRQEPAIDPRLLAETYLTERTKGAKGVYERVAQALGLGEDGPKTAQSAIDRIRQRGWLAAGVSSQGSRSGGSVAGPKLEQARRGGDG